MPNKRDRVTIFCWEKGSSHPNEEQANALQSYAYYIANYRDLPYEKIPEAPPEITPRELKYIKSFKF